MALTKPESTSGVPERGGEGSHVPGPGLEGGGDAAPADLERASVPAPPFSVEGRARAAGVAHAG